MERFGGGGAGEPVWNELGAFDRLERALKSYGLLAGEEGFGGAYGDDGLGGAGGAPGVSVGAFRLRPASWLPMSREAGDGLLPAPAPPAIRCRVSSSETRRLRSLSRWWTKLFTSRAMSDTTRSRLS